MTAETPSSPMKRTIYASQNVKKSTNMPANKASRAPPQQPAMCKAILLSNQRCIASDVIGNRSFAETNGPLDSNLLNSKMQHRLCVTSYRPVIRINDGFKKAHGFQRKDAKAQRCQGPHTLFAAPRLCAFALNLSFTSPSSKAATAAGQTAAVPVVPSASETRARNK